ncbi:MAG: endolytic transglycosylase MltG [Candidatus Gracilibacteria bacterium]
MKILKITGAVLALLIVGFGYFYWQLFTLVRDEAQSAEPVFVEIAPGENFTQILTDLKEKNLIRNETVFKIYSRMTGLDKDIKAGRFKIDPELAPAGVAFALANPANGKISVTIPEGFTIFEIDKKLTSLGLIKSGDFKKWASTYDASKFSFIKDNKLEGYLFPDTYFVFSANFNPSDLGEAMLENFQRKVAPELAQQQGQNRTMADIINMASILEKEVKISEDYPIVSGILWKRLDQKWPLQADSTLLYGKDDRTLSYEDLQNDSPYSTYTRQGLPITPICNPGIKAIRASLNQEDSEYWFYLTRSDGKAVYSKTNEEHEKNKQRFL